MVHGACANDAIAHVSQPLVEGYIPVFIGCKAIMYE